MQQNPDFEKLFETSPGLYLVLDPALKIVAVTEEYLKATMTTREGILGKGLFEVFPDNPDDQNASGEGNLRSSLQNVVTNKLPDSMAVQKYDIRKPAAAGGGFEERFWSPKNLPVLNAKGELIYILHKVEDVTEFVRLKAKESAQQQINTELLTKTGLIENEILHRAQEIQEYNKKLLLLNKELTEKTVELKRSNEELDLFASIAAHDIQAPFRSIVMALDGIEEELGASVSPGIIKYFGVIKKSRERVKALIENLLQFARVSQNPEPFQKVDLQKVVNDTLKIADSAKLSVKITGTLPVIMADGTQMMQLFQNLIQNALKFQDKDNPEIVISAESFKGYYQFGIKDNGIGIDEKYFTKIFQVFQRLHSKDQYPGTGLGLSICKKIVERHGGKIWVTSQPGAGTTFRFTLNE